MPNCKFETLKKSHIEAFLAGANWQRENDDTIRTDNKGTLNNVLE